MQKKTKSQEAVILAFMKKQGISREEALAKVAKLQALWGSRVKIGAYVFPRGALLAGVVKRV